MQNEATDIAPLLTAEGSRLLEAVGPYDADDALGAATRLRAAGHDPRLVSAVLTQARLRARAREKFGDFADRMLFTRAGLEQATRLRVAALHARRFADADLVHVADLGCGIGADALALASLDRRVTAVELDETTAAVATLNLLPFPEATVLQADVEQLDLTTLPGGPPDGVWLDPARRTTSSSGTRRIFDPEAFSPPLSFVEALAGRGLPVGVKLGPGIPHEAIPAGCEAQWVSDRGDVVEAVLWFNAVARPGVRRAALVLSEHGSAELASPEDHDPAHADAVVGPVGAYLYEPDGAVIRAGLVTDLARQLGARLIHPRIAYLTSDELVRTPLARAYRVREVLPHTVKVLKRWVREHEVGTLEIKKRGTDVTPEELRRRLAPKGPGRATLVVTRTAPGPGPGGPGRGGAGPAEQRVVIVVETVD
ncbi:class I SAM-dependent methyltransferase [Kocuria sp. WN036]|uniref:class I SAM-dependent methyltransferase n=1 Tax=Kocuria sp. WN036 TaxID=2032628 RepID=UPI00114102BA|nr:class I SAM-dependent methyltransferase [Kocuria sp. WN036]